MISAGDLAGENLVLGVISHILHPHPEINPLSLSSLLKVAVIFSHWVNLEMKVSSNRLQDPVSPETTRGWTQDYLGTVPLDNYNQPKIGGLLIHSQDCTYINQSVFSCPGYSCATYDWI